MNRRIVITVCPREAGIVVMPVERGGRRRRLNASRIFDELNRLVSTRRLEAYVRVRDACAGGCGFRGPNVSVTIHPPTRPGEPVDHVAVGWKSYVGVLNRLDCLEAVIDNNLSD